MGRTLQQAEPQEEEERGNEDLHGKKVDWRDQGKEQAQAAREEEVSEAGKMCKKEENEPKPDSKL